ncbi:unnamed protein product [Rotaria sp. Silwood2]|nr:unnamed protein product [Rotaria sp. Silwood2]
MYPSVVNKSTEPCPISSSSLITTSLISNNHSTPISNNSTLSSLQSYGKRENTLTHSIGSSLNNSNDYYTQKRIEELHERMDDIQISSFLKFINYHLSLEKDEKKNFINDLSKDLCNGHILIDLIEILSSTKLKREHGRTRFHSLTNVQYVLDYLKLRMQHIDITPDDIVSGNRKQILALLWIIIRTFDLPAFRITNKNCFVEKTLLGFGQDRSTIINWLNYILNQNKSENCLFKYFTELKRNILTILKTNHIEKLIQNNSYAKQVLDTVIQTGTEHSAHIISNNEEYLSCIEDDHQQVSTKQHIQLPIDSIGHLTSSSSNNTVELSDLRTLERSRLFYDEQQEAKLKRKYSSEKIEDLQRYC